MSETLTPSQARQITTQFSDIVSNAKNNVRANVNDFEMTLMREWADKNAVDFQKKLHDVLNQVKSDLDKNQTTFNTTVSDIVSAYARVGGMSIIDMSGYQTFYASPTMTWDISVLINETFDGDKFGFEHPESAETLMQALKDLVTKINALIAETTSRLKGINAFGNTEVGANLAISGGKIIEILKEGLAQIESSATKAVADAAAAYIKTGAAAAAAATISK